jgi:hypothetical protein
LCCLAAALFLSGCTPNDIIRPNVEVCPGLDPAACGSYSIEEWKLGNENATYLMGFVEFDDQGQMHDRRQINTLFQRMAQDARNQDLCIINFVHGWKHDSRPSDGNVQQFRTLLNSMAQMEFERGKRSERAKKVVGIYAGWGGQSLEIPEPILNVTFWARKNAAHRVAAGSIRELFSRARHFVDDVNASGENRATSLMTIGHSFGGLIVYDALSQYLIDNATISDPANDKFGSKPVQGFGDVVLVINPAIEALRYEPINKAIWERQTYAPWQKPVFIEVTTTADLATGVRLPYRPLVQHDLRAIQERRAKEPGPDRIRPL